MCINKYMDIKISIYIYIYIRKHHKLGAEAESCLPF